MTQKWYHPTRGWLSHKKVWFFGGDLVTVYKELKSQGLVVLTNHIEDRLMTTSIVDFKKFRKKPYTVKETAHLMGYTTESFRNLVYEKIVPRGMWRGLGGEPYVGGTSYYTEEQVFEIREVLSTMHTGRPRADGLITNTRVPSERQLRALLNNDLVVYVKDQDGNFIPTFPETI